MEISKETLALINTFKSPIIALLSDVKKEVSFFFDDGVLKYVQCFKQKYERTKTFLFRGETVDFYETFYPVTVRNNKEKINIENLEDIFRETNFISIIGNAGSGKSMLMKHLFLSSIKQIFQIPIVIELRNLNHYEGTFFDYVKNTISSKKLAPSDKILIRILESGKFLFLLDGYDEIFSENKEKLSAEIENFTDRFNQNLFILTSRPGANVEAFPRFESCYVKPLTTKQISGFIDKQLGNAEDETLAEKIKEVIAKPENVEYHSYLSSPLLLSMFMLTFNSYPELPKLKSKFYWNVYDTLSTKHDTFTKHGGYQHERISGLQNEDISNILEWFSYISIFEGNYNFDSEYLNKKFKTIIEKLSLECQTEKVIQDVIVAISIIIQDGLEYKFPHKSLQEYFAASLIASLSKEAKEKVYSEKVVLLNRFTHGGNTNFWNLCNELDPISFNKYFVLKHLKEFIFGIDKSSKESMVFCFFRLIGFKQGFKIKDGADKYEFNSFEYWSIPIESIMPYLGIGSYSRLSLAAYKKANNYVSVLIDGNYVVMKRVDDKEETNYILDYTAKWDSTLFAFIDSVGLADYIIEVLKKIDQKILLIEKDIEVREKNTQSLLDL